jgi:hypothetical protein
LCTLTLNNDDKIEYSILGSNVLGVIEYLKPKEQDDGYFLISKRLCGGNFYFKTSDDLLKHLKAQVHTYQVSANASLELFFTKYAKSFSPSYVVVDEDQTVFTNIMTLNHKGNSWFKKLLGLNKYETVFVSGFFLENTVLYCVSAYKGDGDFNCALCSTKYANDLPKILNEILSTQRNFEFI